MIAVQNKGRSSDKGFTLIEMAIVSIIVGVVLAAFATPLSLYFKDKKAKITYEGIETATNATMDYLSIQGRYPCPAATNLNRNNPDYGRSTDCGDTSVAAGACANGICIEQNERTFINPVTGVAENVTLRVRIGALPFRDMGLPEEAAVDGYGMKYKYAVTEVLANPDVTFDASRGGIDIVDDENNSVITPEKSGHFLLLSSGRDQKGGITRENADIPCDLGSKQAENCALSVNAVFRKGTYSEVDGYDYFDDVLSYFTTAAIPLWETSKDDSATPFDINQIPSGGSLQFLSPVESAPSGAMDLDTIDVSGSIKASGVDSDGDGETDNNGQAMVTEICDPLNPDSDEGCFPSSLIAGDTGISCPAGEVATQVAGKGFICRPVNQLSVTCPPNTYAAGVRADGTLNCIGTIPISCQARTVTLCNSNDVTLPAAANGVVTEVFSRGFCRTARYRCNSGVWTQTNVRGSCVETQTQSNVACDAGYTGTRSRVRTFNCATNAWGPYVDVMGDTYLCVCDINATRTRPLSCPPGLSGVAFMPQARTCDPIGWVDAPPAVYNCTCTPEGPYGTTTACEGGLSGTRVINRYQYVCSPGRTYQALPDIDNCTCDPDRTQVTTRACPTGYSGEITVTRQVICPSGTWGPPVEDSSACTPIPPVICKWVNNDTVTQTDTDRYSVNEKGASGCTCGATGRCYERMGPSAYRNYTSCVCTGG